jgi:hypothetical protein
MEALLFLPHSAFREQHRCFPHSALGRLCVSMMGAHSGCQAFGKLAGIGAIAFCAVLACVAVIAIAAPAKALPSFARQTGQPCGTCHTDFPALTPFGRRFKLLGYTVGGGQFRTTPLSVFPIGNDPTAVADRMRASAGAPRGDDKDYVPPVAMMTIVGFTHTQAPQPPPTAPFAQNDNTVISPFSAFWGGAITDHVGAFAQVTHNAPPPGGFPDPFGHTWTWDNTDVRFANSASVGAWDMIYGITANNNPTVQDVWNTTPAWSFPYAASTVAPTPAAKTIIEGAFAAHVGGVGAYALLSDILYVEGSGYRTLDFGAQNALGTDPFGAPGLFDGTAPYWRVAFEPQWGRHSLMVGTFGMHANVNPWIDPTFALGTTATFPQTDKYTDVGFDSQYQYQGGEYWLTLRASYVREFQRRDATFAKGGSANPNELLNSLHMQASVAYGGDNRMIVTGQYFDLRGTSDPILYGGFASGLSPNSNGFTGEIAYMAFGTGRAPGWPWLNARIGLQYTYYNKFDGTSLGAHNRNTLFLYTWLAW